MTMILGMAQIRATATPTHTFVELSSQQENAVEWALDLFDRAELDLPSIEFVGKDAKENCHGRDGVARPTEDGALITLCGSDVGRAQEWVILHEIAHAWDYHNLDTDTRSAFLELRGHDAWREGVWHERGSENAAEILVWGLIDRPSKPIRIYGNSCEELRAGYVTLTGAEPMHGYTDVCSS